MLDIFKFFRWFDGKSKENLNLLTANDYYDRLKMIGLSLFEWEGLPETCNVRFLEKTLFMYGRALFIKDKSLGYLNMKCTPSGNLNTYDEPISYHAYSTVYSENYGREDCVLIRNNYLERPTEESILLFANRLTTAERTIDVNINAQKTPVLIRCDDKDRLSMKNLYNNYEGNAPFILGSKQLNIDGLQVLKTDAPYVADKVQAYKKEVWNEALTFFGINNANSEKRERLITDEVNANNEVININADAMLLTRQEACKEINDKYGLSVSVKLRCFDEQKETKETEVIE